MTLSEYKEKGILEAYILGVLDPESTEKLKSDLKTNIALREELEKAESNLENFKRNFTKGQKSQRPATTPKIKKSQLSTSEKSIRIILGVLVLVMVVMIFLFLSTIYENNNFRTVILEQLETIDSLENKIQKTQEINKNLQLGIADLIRGTASIATFRGAGDFSEKNAYLIAGESTSSTDFLIVQPLKSNDEGGYFQLWSESAGQFRRVGRVIMPKNGENWIVHPLPQTNLQLSHISLESGSPPSQPIAENLIFILN